MKKITRSHNSSDRYQYDFRTCTPSNGWAQLDTEQCASYFGQWINPTERKIVTYCEGDEIFVEFDTDEELREELARTKKWNQEQGHRFIGIDPLMVPALAEALICAGLQEFITPGAVENIEALAERICVDNRTTGYCI